MLTIPVLADVYCVFTDASSCGVGSSLCHQGQHMDTVCILFSTAPANGKEIFIGWARNLGNAHCDQEFQLLSH